MIFLDTSAIYAAADAADPNHGAARTAFGAALTAGEALLTHNYVLVESLALLQRRLGIASAVRFAREAAGLEIQWVDAATHRKVADDFARRGRRGVSFVDCASFHVMRTRGVRRAMAFDEDFEREGFALFVG